MTCGGGIDFDCVASTRSLVNFILMSCGRQRWVFVSLWSYYTFYIVCFIS